jgi:hypothetical protein
MVDVCKANFYMIFMNMEQPCSIELQYIFLHLFFSAKYATIVSFLCFTFGFKFLKFVETTKKIGVKFSLVRNSGTT